MSMTATSTFSTLEMPTLDIPTLSDIVPFAFVPTRPAPAQVAAQASYFAITVARPTAQERMVQVLVAAMTVSFFASVASQIAGMM